MRGLPLLGLFLLTACQVAEVPGKLLSKEISVEQEIEIGADVHAQVRAQAELVSDPILLAYLNDLGQQMVRVTEPQPFIYRFNLIVDDSLNAFAVPGGYIYIHTGVLAQAGNTSELVGVLAHEVAHVRRRHIAKAQEQSGATTIATLLAVIAASAAGSPDLAAAVATVASGVNVGMQLKHTRQHEADADYQGIHYMALAGYSPTGMTRFFQRILTSQPGAPGRIPPYLYSHPAIEERIGAAKLTIARLDPTELAPESDALPSPDKLLAAMQARLAALLDPVAGGTGLLARANFDRARTDPLLDQAASAFERRDLKRADALLARAQRLEPGDPRVALQRAEIAEERNDPNAAVAHLTRAFELDPSVALVQYQLGLAHKRLGNRTRAVFYLEQAANNFNAGSSARERAEFEIASLSFPVLERSGLSSEPHGADRSRFARGDAVVWWARVGTRFTRGAPTLEVRWIDPLGAVAHEERLTIAGRRDVESRLDTRRAAVGRWRVEVRAGDSRLDRHEFLVDGAREPGA